MPQTIALVLGIGILLALLIVPVASLVRSQGWSETLEMLCFVIGFTGLVLFACMLIAYGVQGVQS